MLLRFETANYRSIMDPVELSMIAVDEDRPAARSFQLLNERVLATAGIYGPNASGKSNVVEALAWLSMAVRSSLRAWDKNIPRETFKFGRGPDEPSRCDIEMVVAGIRYAYQVEVDDSTVRFEGLYSYPERRRRVLFEREDLEISFRRGLGSLAGTRELLTPSTLALSAAMRFQEPDVEPFARALAGIQALGLRRPGFLRSYGMVPGLDSRFSTERLFEQQETLFEDFDLAPYSGRGSALALLRFADLGIDDVKIVYGEDVATLPQQAPRRRRRLRLMHRVADQKIPFELSEESAGTQTWFALIGPALSALGDGRVLLVDEIDASLHPRLSARLVELFQDPESNPNGAQLIFTTHDTSLLNFLNRDEVWLTEKGDNGATTLTALAEYGGDKVRRSLNLERAYLQGRFGAVPDLDQYTLRRALGLVRDES
jgi:predicted ATPase